MCGASCLRTALTSRLSRVLGWTMAGRESGCHPPECSCHVSRRSDRYNVAATACSDRVGGSGMVTICSDAKTAIMPKSHRITFCLVLESRSEQNRLFNSDHWVSGHSGLGGNEGTDELERRGTLMDLVVPEPVVGLPLLSVKKKVTSWVYQGYKRLWCAGKCLRQVRALISGSEHRRESFWIWKWKFGLGGEFQGAASHGTAYQALHIA